MQTAKDPDSHLSDLDFSEVDSEDVWSELRSGYSDAAVTRYEKLDRRNGASLLLCSTLSGKYFSLISFIVTSSLSIIRVSLTRVLLF